MRGVSGPAAVKPTSTRQELAGPLNGEQPKQLGMVQGSARHLLELINDVLDRLRRV